MATIPDLVLKIKKEISAKNPIYLTIPDPEMVIRGFEGLDAVVGNEKVKAKAIKQFKHIIVINSDGSADDIQSCPMMNTCMFGPPGTGKTTIANNLALIWAGSGYLTDPNGNKKPVQVAKNVPVQEQQAINWEDFLGILMIIGIILYVAFMAYSLGKSLVSSTYQQFGWIWMLVITFLVIIGLIILYWYIASVNHPNKAIIPSVPRSVTGNYSPKVVIATRASFVGQYLGQTERKTLDFLEANRGNVILFDEAYSLLQEDRDLYGKQAAAEIVKFLSENPKALILILAGYEDDLVNGLFRIQQGMERRFLWKFYCDSYTPEELHLIFKRHANDRGFEVLEEEKVKELIMSNAVLFKNFGGDCARLFDYAQQEYSDAYLNGIVKKKQLSYAMIEEGIKELRAINARKAPTSKLSSELGFLEQYLPKK